MEKNKIVVLLSEKQISKIGQVAPHEELNIQTANTFSSETCMVYVRNKKNETYVISISEEGYFIDNMLAAFKKLKEFVEEESETKYCVEHKRNTNEN